MRVILTALAAFVLTALPATAAPGSCVVTPNPVSLGSDFTITATGLTPGGWYWINVTQAKDSSNGAHPQGIEQADTNGSFAYMRNTNAGPDAILGVGRAKARIYPMSDDSLGFPNVAQGTANCWFDVD